MKQIKSEPAEQQGSLWAVFARDTKLQLNLMFFILFIFIIFLVTNATMPRVDQSTSAITIQGPCFVSKSRLHAKPQKSKTQ
ncbi:hypothetical protein I7I53_01543 [Histoplasma capsulatum var. duboisii H88]|uniref:Uncharacterized protein n=1 Tax=Ajellomyces capsulatus (strain H88) TaxID=544711 RepID=A0A8A1LQ48_AJEC8|nr:hypothetical protein I7I53_01543 [Histoplasma capsulatum var. duboisii H88]